MIANPLTYKSSIECPRCKHRVLPEHGIIQGANEALKEEDRIVRVAFARTGAEHSSTGTIVSFVKLQACYNRLILEDDSRAEVDKSEEPLEKQKRR